MTLSEIRKKIDNDEYNEFDRTAFYQDVFDALNCYYFEKMEKSHAIALADKLPLNLAFRCLCTYAILAKRYPA